MCPSTEVVNKMVVSLLFGNCSLCIRLFGLGPQREMGSVVGSEYSKPTVNSEIMFVNVIVTFKALFKLWCHSCFRFNINTPRIVSLSLTLSLCKGLALLLNSAFGKEEIITSLGVREKVWSKETLVISAVNPLAEGYHINIEFHFIFQHSQRKHLCTITLGAGNKQPFY